MVIDTSQQELTGPVTLTFLPSFASASTLALRATGQVSQSSFFAASFLASSFFAPAFSSEQQSARFRPNFAPDAVVRISALSLTLIVPTTVASSFFTLYSPSDFWIASGFSSDLASSAIVKRPLSKSASFTSFAPGTAESPLATLGAHPVGQLMPST